MRKLYFVNGFSMFGASQLYVCLLRYLPRFPQKVVTVTEVTVFLKPIPLHSLEGDNYIIYNYLLLLLTI